MAESLPTGEVESGQNHFYHRLLEKCFQSKPPDVHFILNGENGPVKIPAHKELLVVSSPVFAAMFNGELHEEDDVTILDASIEGFKEFLQFFYSKEVNLSMENVGDVLNLTHKYDIVDCFATALSFLMYNLTADKMLWGLQLALKNQSDDLKTFCKEQIALDIEGALNVFEFKDNNGMTISTTDPLLLDTNLTSLWMEVFSLRKEILLQKVQLVPFILSGPDVYRGLLNVSNEVTIVFNPYKFENALWLHEIHFAKFYKESGATFEEIPLKGTVAVTCDGTVLFEKQFNTDVAKHIKLANPIHFDARSYYSIKIKPSVAGYPSGIDPQAFEGPFKGKLHICFECTVRYTLIDRLCFEELPNE